MGNFSNGEIVRKVFTIIYRPNLPGFKLYAKVLDYRLYYTPSNTLGESAKEKTQRAILPLLNASCLTLFTAVGFASSAQIGVSTPFEMLYD